MPRLKKTLDPMTLREKNIECLFESKENSSLGATLRLIGYRLLESTYHIFPFMVPGIIYAYERTRPDAEHKIKENAYNSLLRKGYPKDKVKDFIEKVST